MNLNRQSKTYLLILYFAGLLVCGYLIFPFWTVVLAAWIMIFGYSLWRGLHHKLPSRLRKLFLYTGVVYPLVETFIKFIIINELIPGSWEWLNRLEHFGFSMFISFLLLPMLYPHMQKLTLPGQALLFVGAVVLLGNFNEFAEYLLRSLWGLYANFATYYWDTIMDLGVNILGATVGFMVVSKLNRTIVG